MKSNGSGAVRPRNVASTASTNGDLLDDIAAGNPPFEGEWLIADRQTAGRGRRGRAWSDGAGNFMGSTTIRFLPTDPPPATLSLVAGLALFEAVAPLVPPLPGARLKWPNDLLIGGAKVAGILLERANEWIVMGFGVNLVSAPVLPDRATAALSSFGPAPDRDLFAANLAQHLAVELDRWRQYGLDPMLRRWTSAAHPVGTALQVHPPGEGQITGEFAGLTDDGSLRLRAQDGSVRTITAGDVTLGQRG
jgi:BirA family biotin operon repressor/biotin-[acetyl-CoA-carboxylase] ligase